jgi:Family of unknown function (DUF5681)
MSDYKIGYRNPPKHTQFKPGESGNPEGRPRKRKLIEEVILNELDSVLTVNVGGKSANMNSREALFRTIERKAMQGDPKALKQILALAENEQLKREKPLVIAITDDETGEIIEIIKNGVTTWEKDDLQ